MAARWAWLFDVGSTFTKLAVVDIDNPDCRWRAQAPTTVHTDVRDGFHAAVDAVHRQDGPRFEDAALRAASSSAAGGLALVVSGLVPRLSAEAGRVAALGAGAKLVGSWSHRLTPGDIVDIEGARPDIVLLTGGTDGGDRRTLLENTKALAAWKSCPAVIVAGNRDVAGEAVELLSETGIRARAVPNILPELDRLEVGPVRAAIREEFLANIVTAKGIDRLGAHLDVEITPTPAAVLDGVGLLAERLFPGGLMAVEVGGATTNVHSWSAATPDPTVVVRGVPEPALKRTVEGDLGVRWNAGTILELLGLEWFEEQGIEGADAFERYVARVAAAPVSLPETDAERRFDFLMAAFAAQTAIQRHCGHQREVVLPTGVAYVQTGKDLRGVEAVLGTGGPVINATDPVALVTAAVHNTDPFVLLPRAPKVLIDREYLLYAVGLLAQLQPEASAELSRQTMREIAAPTAS
jgi:uncharacterized protein (TIGR01319 family)